MTDSIVDKKLYIWQKGTQMSIHMLKTQDWAVWNKIKEWTLQCSIEGEVVSALLLFPFSSQNFVINKIYSVISVLRLDFAREQVEHPLSSKT